MTEPNAVPVRTISEETFAKLAGVLMTLEYRQRGPLKLPPRDEHDVQLLEVLDALRAEGHDIGQLC